MDNSKENMAEAKEQNTTVTTKDGDKVDTTTGEILNKNTENKTNTEVKDEKTSTSADDAKRPLTETEAREYVASLPLKHIDIKEMYEVMQVPSKSNYEFRMAAYIILWARKNGVDYKFDKKGNIYLTKGTLAEGEFYPCVTSHMDTVQTKAVPYALAGAELPLRTRRVKSTTSDEIRHEVYIDGQGIGADDKLGVYISLQLIKKIDKIKAAFFVEEEVGMLGSKDLDAKFFEDVAYVIGWDSPDLLRAAWKCSGTQLFSSDFYKKHLAPVVKRWGFTDKCFHSEPFTDVVQIREKTEIMCMNFGNGGYNAHADNEYLVIEHVDHAIGMGEDIIKSIGCKEQFKLKKKSYVYNANDWNNRGANDEDECDKLFGTYTQTYTHNTYNSGSTNTNRSDGKVESSTKVEGIKEETVKYIVDTYDDYINNIKTEIDKKCDVLEDILKDKFREAGIDYKTLDINFKEEIIGVFNKEIKF